VDDLALHASDALCNAAFDLLVDIAAAANLSLDEAMIETISTRVEDIRPQLAGHDEITPDLLRRLLNETTTKEAT
jgi:hypothetical protein